MQTSLCLWTVRIANRSNPGDVRFGDNVTGANISKTHLSVSCALLTGECQGPDCFRKCFSFLI